MNRIIVSTISTLSTRGLLLLYSCALCYTPHTQPPLQRACVNLLAPLLLAMSLLQVGIRLVRKDELPVLVLAELLDAGWYVYRFVDLGADAPGEELGVVAVGKAFFIGEALLHEFLHLCVIER